MQDDTADIEYGVGYALGDSSSHRQNLKTLSPDDD